MMTSTSYFCSSGYIQDSEIITDSGYKLDMQALSPFLRTLMVMDGTVTKSLSSWFWEPVKINPLLNQTEISKYCIDGIEVETGDKIIRREVALLGDKSKQVFAYARSTVSIKHLPTEIGKALERGEVGIGELLREQGIETYREIYNINYYDKNNIKDEPLLSKVEGEVISRSYRIMVNGVPSIIVTEYFPLDVYHHAGDDNKNM